jgi:hypothetical protein
LLDRINYISLLADARGLRRHHVVLLLARSGALKSVEGRPATWTGVCPINAGWRWRFRRDVVALQQISVGFEPERRSRQCWTGFAPS